MKPGWKTAKFKDVSTIIGGSTPKTDIPDYWGGDNYWVAPAELDGSKFISSTVKRITDLAVSKTNLSLLPQGTVLLSSRAPIGKVAITTVPMYCNQGFKNIVCGPELFNGYVYYFLKHNVSYLQSLGTGATFKEVSKKVVENVSITFPSLEEQHRIVDEMDLLTGIIDKKKAQLQDLNSLATTYFYELFGDPVENSRGWAKKRVEDIAQVKIGPFGSLLHKSDYITGGVPLVNPVHMRDLRIVADNDFSISDTKKQELNSYLLKEGDIVIARRGDIGRCALVTAEDNGYLCGTGSMFVRPAIKLESLFLVHLLSSKEMVRELLHQAKGVTMLNINCDIVSNLEVIVPPVEEQKNYVTKILALEEQKQLILSSIQATEALLNSRTEYYFAE